MHAMKKEILAIESENFGCYTQGHDFEVGEFGNNSTSGHVSQFIHTISSENLADSKRSNRVYGLFTVTLEFIYDRSQGV